MFLNSRECVHDVMAGVQYDNIAFHEGNVPAAIQTILGQKMYRLSFMNVHEYGGFQKGVPVPLDAEYSLGYRHMVSTL
eukprot:6498813-Prymnesium_polylepis.1